jgi:hypothetical protein
MTSSYGRPSGSFALTVERNMYVPSFVIGP